PLESFYRTLLMLFGLANPVPLAVAMALTGWGIKRVWERDRDLTRYWVVVCAVGIVAVAAARPMWVQHPLVLARYSLPVLPFILVFLSEGLVALVERANRPAIAPVFATAVVAGAFAIG